MKHLLFPLCLLVSVTPLLAHDEGGDGAVIPSYQELIREGYGPRNYDGDELYRRSYLPARETAKPTQAFYGPGYVVYYGYTPVRLYDAGKAYAFGYPTEFYTNLMSHSVNELNLNRYAVAVGGRNSSNRNRNRDHVTHPGTAVTAVVSTSATGTQASPTATVPTATTGTAPAAKAAAAPVAGDKAAH
jgi:hypothetical protein